MTVEAMILAAGQGTRLRPLTDDRPKCLVELAGRPLLAWQLDALTRAGIRDITVVGGYRHEMLKPYCRNIVINPRFDSTNMVSSLFAAEDRIREGTDDLLIIYGDIVYESRVVREALAAAGDLAVVVDTAWFRYWSMRMDDPLGDAETLRLKDGNVLVELGRRPRSIEDIEGQYIGMIKVPAGRRGALADFWCGLDRNAQFEGRSFDHMFMTAFIQRLIDAGWVVTAAFTSSGWLEVDTVDDLQRYEALRANGTLDSFCALGT